MSGDEDTTDIERLLEEDAGDFLETAGGATTPPEVSPPPMPTVVSEFSDFELDEEDLHQIDFLSTPSPNTNPHPKPTHNPNPKPKPKPKPANTNPSPNSNLSSPIRTHRQRFHVGSGLSPSVTPQQIDRMKKNKAIAQIKLLRTLAANLVDNSAQTDE